jgi:ribosomal protein L16 Arg81 hydroxylase
MTRAESRVHAVSATVDRIEGAIAVLDAAGVVLQVPIGWLHHGVREGDGVTVSFARGDARPLGDSVRDRLAKLTGQK